MSVDLIVTGAVIAVLVTAVVVILKRGKAPIQGSGNPGGTGGDGEPDTNTGIEDANK